MELQFQQAATRVQQQRKTRKWIKYLIWGVSVLLILALLVCIGISAYVGWNLTHPEREPITSSPADYGLAYEDVTFPSRDGEVNLKGWFLPAEIEAKMTLIMAHGYEHNRQNSGLPALEFAKPLVAAGYQLLLFDFRNSGESEGDMTSVGQFEKQDLLGAIDWVKQHYNQPIGLIGYSMGASTALITAAEAPEVVGVVADSPFNNLRNYLEDNLSIWSDLPNFPFTPLIMTIIPPLTGMDPDEVDPLSSVDQIYPRPVLFIHGDGDDAIPYQHSEAMYQKHPDVFTLWIPKGAGHIEGYNMYPEEYTEKVIQFFDKLSK